MAYLDDMVLVTRSLIYDMDTPYTYSDTKVKQLMFSAAKLLSFEVDLSAYTIDINAQTIVPDPSNDVQALICLKTACMLANAESKVYTMDSIVIKDGPSTIDTTSAVAGMNQRRKTVCEEFEQAKINFISGGGNGGIVISGPMVEDYYYDGKVGNI